MTQEERNKIVSNEYADLIIRYNGDEAQLNRFQNDTINIVSTRYAVVHIPVEEFGNSIIAEFGYGAVPACYGLVSAASLEASGIRRLRNLPNFALRGQGILIGIVDTGIDYTNPVFKNADNTTRIVSIWDQTIYSENGYPPNTFYGTEYKKEQINEALIHDNPLEFVPSTDEIGHGTMLAGISGGNEVPESNFYGVAPDAEFVVVKVKPIKQYLRDFFSIPNDAICYQENDIMFGVRYLLDFARQLGRPIAICIGLGTSQGSHDGSSPLSEYLSINADVVGTAIVIAAGNEGNAKRHFYSLVDPAIGHVSVELNVGENEGGFSMEIWGNTPSTYSIDILSPTGEYIPRIPPQIIASREISFIFEKTKINVDYQLVESQTGDQLILIRFKNPTAGIWSFKVYKTGDLKVGFHIWLPMGNFITENTYFIRSDPDTTVLESGDAFVPITVTAYDDQNDSLYLNAGKGYTRLGIVKPEIAAPGVNVICPTLDHGFTSATGTSVATAHTTGIAAMMLEWGIINRNYNSLDSLGIKKFLMKGARRNVSMEYPNTEWGYGILDIYNVFDILRVEMEGGE